MRGFDLHTIKKIEDKYNVKCYVYGEGVREYIREGFNVKFGMKILIDGERNEDILKQCPYDITFMSLEDFFNSRIADIDKILLDSNRNPIVKGSCLKDLKRGEIKIDIDKVVKDERIILEYLTFMQEGYKVNMNELYNLRQKIKFNTIIDMLRKICSLNNNVRIAENVIDVFYEIGGINALFGDNNFYINRLVSSFDSRIVLSYPTSLIGGIIPSTDISDFDKFKTYIHFLALYLYKQRKLYAEYGYRIDDIDEYEFVYSLYKRVLKLNDDEIAIYLNEIECISEDYFSLKKWSLVNYGKDLKNVEKLTDLGIDNNFLYATSFIR